MSRTTYQDLIDHLTDFVGGNPSDSTQRDARRAIQQALRDVANAHRWTYLLAHGRVITDPPYVTGTIRYEHDGGALARQVTLTGGTWPAWAIGGYIRVGFQAWKVEQRVSDAVVVLDEQVNPGVDVAAGTSYKLYRDGYLLPEDFIATDQALYERNFGGMDWVHPREWLFEERFVFAEGVPQVYSVMGDALYPGRLVLRVAPHPAEQKTIDFLYNRRPRPLTIALVNDGKAAISLNGTTVTGTGTAFHATMVGAVLRVSSDPLAYPTGPIGDNPAAFETTITGYSSATSITIADASPTAFGSARYTISDPLDVEEGGMLNAVYRACEANLAIGRNLKEKAEVLAIYQQALKDARAADSRTFAGRVVGDQRPLRQRLRDMPWTPDVE